eukprot:gene1001-2611_t
MRNVVAIVEYVNMFTVKPLSRCHLAALRIFLVSSCGQAYDLDVGNPASPLFPPHREAAPRDITHPMGNTSGSASDGKRAMSPGPGILHAPRPPSIHVVPQPPAPPSFHALTPTAPPPSQAGSVRQTLKTSGNLDRRRGQSTDKQ